MLDTLLKVIREEECESGQFPDCPYCGESLEEVLPHYHYKNEYGECTCNYCEKTFHYNLELNCRYSYTFKEDCRYKNLKQDFRGSKKSVNVLMCENDNTQISANTLKIRQIGEDGQKEFITEDISKIKRLNKVEHTEKEYYKSGSIKRKTPYKNSKREGVEVYYYESGELHFKTQYKDDKKEGTEVWYYRDGTIKREEPLINDKIHGILKEYHDNGNLYLESLYINGTREGVEKLYYKNGKLNWATSYKNGSRHGIRREFSKKGDIIEETLFKNGYTKRINDDDEILEEYANKEERESIGKCENVNNYILLEEYNKSSTWKAQ